MMEMYAMNVIFFLGALLVCITILGIMYMRRCYLDSKENNTELDKKTLGEIGVVTFIFFIGAIMCFCSVDIGEVASHIFSTERQTSNFFY